MKQLWIKYSTRIDAMTLRERAMVFCAAAGIIIFLAYTALLDPVYVKQKVLRAQISQQQNNITGLDADITQRVDAYAVDPDAATRVRLQSARREVERLGTAMRTMQQGLVAPDKMVPLLQTLLRGNDKLKLVSLRTLPVSGLSEAPVDLSSEAKASARGVTEAQVLSSIKAEAAKSEAKAAEVKAEAAPVAMVKPAELVYRHGVEIVLQGGYLDMISYMAALEDMPTQLFWGKARLEVDQYPSARLSLTLYTLSLDQKWMKL